jgi:hypothetical protein
MRSIVLVRPVGFIEFPRSNFLCDTLFDHDASDSALFQTNSVRTTAASVQQLWYGAKFKNSKTFRPFYPVLVRSRGEGGACS